MQLGLNLNPNLYKMDNGQSGTQEEEIMWKKALLSRDFDLCHTRLLMLEGQVAPEERLHLVRELFSTIKEIEEIVLKDATIKIKAKSALERIPSVRISARDMAATGVNSNIDSMPSKTSEHPLSHSLQQPSMDFSTFDVNDPQTECPICCTRERKGFRHYCDSCRVFMNQLVKMHEDKVPLPECDHQGKQILFGCKGCRRYRYQLYWPHYKSEPFPLPQL